MLWTTVALMATLAFARTSTFAPLGAPTDADINNPEVQDALNFAVNELNKHSNVYISKVAKVLNAQIQVVEGLLYMFEVKMVRAGYKAGVAERMCLIDDKPELLKPYTCTFEVWSRPWLGPPKIIKNVCEH